MWKPCMVVLLLAPMLLIASCSSDLAADPGSGDCNARVKVDSVVFSARDSVDQKAPLGLKLGMGSILDCDGSSLETVAVYEVSGFDATTVVAVQDDSADRYDGVYVNLDTPSSDWPLQQGVTDSP